MNRNHSRALGHLALLCIALPMAWHGPIPQLADYHAFADQRSWFGLPHACDVLSNLGFLLVGGLGLRTWWREHSGSGAHLAFALAIAATAFGSAWYHWAPDDARLVLDRLPIALACAALLAAVRVDCGLARAPRLELAASAAFAVASAYWWKATGDLRPYLLLQAAPILLLPIWQAGAQRPRAERLAVAGALGLYVLAKGAELADHAILAASQRVSGHTLKHLLATLAAWLLLRALFGGTSHTATATAKVRGTAAVAGI